MQTPNRSTHPVRRAELVGLLVALCGFAHVVWAHQYWLEPKSFFVPVGTPLPVAMYVGDGLLKDKQERPHDLRKSALFTFHANGTKTNINAAEGAMPVYSLVPQRPGNYLISLARNWTSIELDAKTFDDYLIEEGLEHIVAQRAARGESAKVGRERYSRYLKTLIQVGDKQDDTYRKEAGLRLEITPVANPYSSTKPKMLKFAIRFDGKPLVNQAVFAANQSRATQRQVTDQQGHVTFAIDQPDLWMIHLVHMQRCSVDCGDADWESFWGAFTFGAKAR